MNQEEMNQLHKKIKDYISKKSELIFEWYCGWCESFIPIDDIEKKRYKTFIKSKDKLIRFKGDNFSWFFIVCLKCVDNFEEIKSLKEV
jgi:hypothetical protein|tara:strand:- start:907 stop:1170 length:264 start_codon:yes stop_codon:yes gene_type:complete